MPESKKEIRSSQDKISTIPEDISIVMAVYNHESTVAQAIESALSQKMPYTSVIYCLNDASTDNSAEVLSEYARIYPDRVKVYTSKENLGSGKKSFLHHRPPVKGRYWCLLAGDDYWTDSSKLAKQISFLDSAPDYVGCSCNSIVKNEVTGEESLIEPSRNIWNLLDLLLLKHKYAFYVHTTSIIWRNIYIQKGSFLPPEFKKKYASGDVMLTHMMLMTGGKMKNLPEVMSCYRYTGKGVWTSLSLKEQSERNARLEKNIYRLTPLKYKIYILAQALRRKFKVLKNLIQGPINE